MGKARNIADLLNSSGKIDSADIDSSAQFYQFKNRIINGSMMIDQRNAGASATGGVGYTYFVDRFKIYSAGASKLSGQQVSVSTTGFRKALKLTSLAATSPAAGDEYQLYHNIEGFNIADLMWGTANAQPVTLSFVVNSSITGTFAGCLNNEGAGGTVYSYVFTYTVASANTDTVISVTIPGSTAGTWSATNTTGISILWDLGSGSNFSTTAGSWGTSFKCRTSGSVNINGTNGATFYITGVQLEKGSTATSFDYRPYGTELALCQRYYWRIAGDNSDYPSVGSGTVQNTNGARVHIKHPVSMRTYPTFSFGGNLTIDVGNASGLVTSISGAYEGLDTSMLDFAASGGGLVAAGRGCVVYCTNASTHFLQASAEL